MQNIYSQEFLHYYKNQPNKKEINPFDLEGREVNLSCGDDLTVRLKLDQHENIIEVGYTGDGCAVCEGAMSMLAEELEGKHIDYIKSLSEEDFFNFLGLELTPSRQKCALIGYMGIMNSMKNYENKQ